MVVADSWQLFVSIDTTLAATLGCRLVGSSGPQQSGGPVVNTELDTAPG